MQLGVLVQGQSFQSLGAQHVYSLSSWCVRVSIGLCVLSVEWIALPENVWVRGIIGQPSSIMSWDCSAGNSYFNVHYELWILLWNIIDTHQTLKSVSFTRNNEGPKMTSATISRCRREWVAWGLSGRGAIGWLGLRVAAQNLNMSRQRQQSHRGHCCSCFRHTGNI